jgi:hypothetical protein
MRFPRCLPLLFLPFLLGGCSVLDSEMAEPEARNEPVEAFLHQHLKLHRMFRTSVFDQAGDINPRVVGSIRMIESDIEYRLAEDTGWHKGLWPSDAGKLLPELMEKTCKRSGGYWLESGLCLSRKALPLFFFELKTTQEIKKTQNRNGRSYLLNVVKFHVRLYAPVSPDLADDQQWVEFARLPKGEAWRKIVQDKRLNDLADVRNVERRDRIMIDL